jgi:hypothetical protein
VLGVRSFGNGIDADGNGVVVRNTLRARAIPWSDLAAIEFKGVDSEAITNMYYQLVFQRHDGSRVTAEAPGGGIGPGEYLFELRNRLLAMRSAALGDPYPPADRPSDAGGTDEEAAPPADPPYGFRRPGRAAQTRRLPFRLRRRGAGSRFGAVLLAAWR